MITEDEGSAGEVDENDEADGKLEYVKKEFVARPYECTSGVLEEVENSIIKETRPLLQMRISRARREFGLDGINFIDKDANENSFDLKSQSKTVQVP